MWPARRRRKDILQELNLPDVINIRDLCDEVSRRVGRPVVLKPRVQDMCAAVVVRKAIIEVFYDPRADPKLVEHALAHEFAHLLLRHHESRPASALGPEHLPGVDLTTAQLMLGRTHYAEEAERDAERLAYLLQRRITEYRLRTDESSGDEVQDRVTRTLLRRRETRR